MIPPDVEYGSLPAELDNGCVLLVRQEATPILAFRGAVLGGMRWEKRDTSGLGYLYSSIWGSATENYSEEALAKRCALLGGGISTFNGRHSMGIRAEFIEEKADEGLDLVCEAILRSTFDERQLNRERDAVLERLRNRSDRPAAMAFEEFTSQLFPTHPFGMRFMGTEESINGLDVSSLVDFGKDLGGQKPEVWQFFLECQHCIQ